jgi:hypothetical protein
MNFRETSERISGRDRVRNRGKTEISNAQGTTKAPHKAEK